MSKRLDDLLARYAGPHKAKGRLESLLARQQKKPVVPQAPKSVSVAVLPQPASSTRVALPASLSSAFESALKEEARQAQPRPSEVVRRLLAGPKPELVESMRAELLQRARERLPRQPATPRTPPPETRRITPPREGVWGIVAPGSTTLKGRPIAAEAFTGGGLLSIAGLVEGVYAQEICEYDQACIDTLRLNLHSFAEARDAFTWTPSVPDGGLDLLLGGPPCQPFSRGASLGASLDVGPASPRNAYPRVLDWIADAQPRVAVLENSADVTRGGFKAWFDIWWRSAAVLGYEGVFWVLQAADFGTPQNRERAFAVLWPRGAPWGAALRQAPPATHGRPGSPAVERGEVLPWSRPFDRVFSGCCGGYGLSGCVNLGNLEGSCSSCVDGANFQAAPNQSGEEGRRVPTQALVNTYSGLFDEETGRTRLEARRPVPMSVEAAFKPFDPTSRINVEYLSPAITAGGGIKRVVDSLMIPPNATGLVSAIDLGSEKARKDFVKKLQVMSVRDAAKIQDVPQWWAFEGGRGAAWRQVGNGIPVNLGRAVLRHVLAALGYDTPIPGSMASEPFQGLWPLDAADPCARFMGVEGYPGQTYIPLIRAKDLTRPQRQARPFLGPAQHAEVQRSRTLMEPRQQFWTEVEPGLQMPNHARILKSWKPQTREDVPPGFLDMHEFLANLDGEDEDTIQGYVDLYAKVFGGRERAEKRLLGWR